ncbi:MAG: hypothetical protein ACTJFR_02965 [Canibacter sp.]
MSDEDEDFTVVVRRSRGRSGLRSGDVVSKVTRSTINRVRFARPDFTRAEPPRQTYHSKTLAESRRFRRNTLIAQLAAIVLGVSGLVWISLTIIN